MKRTERLDDEVTAQLQTFKGWQSGVWTALPGIIRKYTPSAMTCEVEPTVQARLTDLNGVASWVNLPLLVDCPVCFPAGGGFTLTFPLRDGDECLVVFASRCIDAWWQSGGVQPQAELRMHDLSDGFVIPGPRSKPKALADADAANVELRSDDGAARVKITPGHEIALVTPYHVTMEAAQVNVIAAVNITGPVSISGAVDVTGAVGVTGPVDVTGALTITGALMNNGKNVGGTHKHSIDGPEPI